VKYKFRQLCLLFLSGMSLFTASSMAQESQRQGPAEALFESFMMHRDFRLVSRLDELPNDAKSVLPRQPDGSFFLAEKGEAWSAGDRLREEMKNAKHLVSGISPEMVAIFYIQGSFNSKVMLRLIDRRNKDQALCFLKDDSDEDVDQWNGRNHTRTLLRLEAGTNPRCVLL
jgi:hypothetical protein